jgi:hypothetical protein
MEVNMSKANSRVLYLTGLGICLLATIPLIFGLIGSTFATTTGANGAVTTIVTSFGNPALFWLAIAMYIAGGITGLVGYIGALVKMAQLEQWIWFILLLGLSGITMLVYIFVGPETRSVSSPSTYAHSGR